MNDRRSKPASLETALDRRDQIVHLDTTANPYGMTEHVGAVLAAGAMNQTPGQLESALRSRIAGFAGVPVRQVLVAGQIDELIAHWLTQYLPDAPLIRFPPGPGAVPTPSRRHLIDVHRGPSFQPELDAETASELPQGAIAYLMSPHDPSGALAPARDIVRLARTCALVIVDQRHSGYTTRSLAALAREFDNVVVLQSLETWAALSAFPISWVTGAGATLERLGRPGPVAAGSLLAGIAVFEDRRTVLGNARRVRDERSRLFRMLRKLNMIQPLPSWANFLLARIERGDRETIHVGLAERGIMVAIPDDPALERYLRISAGLPEDTDALRRALVEISVTL